MELDVVCGYRIMWNGKNTSNIMFLDKRRRVKPTIVADAKHLPFRDNVFSKIYCDPPHMIRSDATAPWVKESSKRGHSKIHAKFFDMYGWFNNRSEWKSFILHTDVEFARVLEPNGILWYKLVDGKDPRVTKLRDLNWMKNFQIIEKIAVNTPKQKWRKNTTYELLMKLI